jgi:hypothetical protein
LVLFVFTNFVGKTDKTFFFFLFKKYKAKLKQAKGTDNLLLTLPDSLENNYSIDRQFIE